MKKKLTKSQTSQKYLTKKCYFQQIGVVVEMCLKKTFFVIIKSIAT